VGNVARAEQVGKSRRTGLIQARIIAASEAHQSIPCISTIHAGMSRSITIRNVPDDTGDKLAARAALTGRSLQEYLRTQLIDLAARPDADVLMARIRARKESIGSRISAETIVGCPMPIFNDTGR
jgi:antitoxin FitA